MSVVRRECGFCFGTIAYGIWAISALFVAGFLTADFANARGATERTVPIGAIYTISDSYAFSSGGLDYYMGGPGTTPSQAARSIRRTNLITGEVRDVYAADWEGDAIKRIRAGGGTVAIVVDLDFPTPHRALVTFDDDGSNVRTLAEWTRGVSPAAGVCGTAFSLEGVDRSGAVLVRRFSFSHDGCGSGTRSVEVETLQFDLTGQGTVLSRSILPLDAAGNVASANPFGDLRGKYISAWRGSTGGDFPSPTEFVVKRLSDYSVVRSFPVFAQNKRVVRSYQLGPRGDLLVTTQVHRETDWDTKFLRSFVTYYPNVRSRTRRVVFKTRGRGSALLCGNSIVTAIGGDGLESSLNTPTSLKIVQRTLRGTAKRTIFTQRNPGEDVTPLGCSAHAFAIQSYYDDGKNYSYTNDAFAF